MTKQKRPRLINYKPKGVPCTMCKFALPVDAKHNNYYCVIPEGVYRITKGSHVCGKGEKK